MPADFEAIRTRWAVPLVEQMEAHGNFGAPWIKDAFLRVPRHMFIPRRQVPPADTFTPVDRHAPSDDDLAAAYTNEAILTRVDPPSSSSAPTVMAWMLSWLDLKPGMRVLEIGTGTGFNAALLAVGVGDPKLVHSIDIQPEVTAEAREHLQDTGFGEIQLRCADGGLGWPEAAPFDRIIVTAGTPDIPPAWREQLAEDGVMVMPFTMPGAGDPGLQLRRRGNGLEGSFMNSMYFMNLRGAYGMPDLTVLRASIKTGWNARAALQSAPRYKFNWDWSRWGYGHLAGLWFSVRSREWQFGPFAWEQFMNGKLWTQFHVSAHPRLCVAWDYRSLALYGDPGPVWNFAALIERWKAAGGPAIADYRVTVMDSAGTAAHDPGAGWIERRPAATLHISPPSAT